MRKKKTNSISNNVSEQLETAAQEALEQMNPFEQLMNAGVEYEKEQQEQEDKPKRKRRTKAEIQAEQEAKDDSLLKCGEDSHIIATVEWDQDKDDDTVLPKRVEIPDSILVDDYNIDTVGEWLSNTVGYCHQGFSLSWPEHHDDRDQFCEWEIEKAHLEGKPDPDFDYRRFYQEGDKVYLVRYYATLKVKELIEMKIRTIYARSMVGVIDKQYCQCVDIQDRDNIFYNHKDALDCFNGIKAKTTDEYNEETGKKKRKRKKSESEEEVASPYEDTEESEEDDNE